MPEVTVLMAVYNGMPYLPLAIESILKQTFADLELLIVNDCSTDKTRDVILAYNDPRIRMLDNPVNMKQTRSLNRGLEFTRTELVARMDADDLSHPRRIEMQVAYLREHSEIAVVGSNIRFIDQGGRLIGKYNRPADDLPLRWLQLFFCPVSNGAAMFRRSIIWDRLGGYDSSFNIAQDWELWSRVFPLYKIANLPELLLDVRKHPGADSIKSRTSAHEEEKRINRSNPQRILGISNPPEEWLRKVDTLIEERIDHPEHRVEVTKEFLKRFCELYPAAHRDPEILSQFSLQVLLSIYFSKPQRLPQVFKALWSYWPRSAEGIEMMWYVFREATCKVARRVRRLVLANGKFLKAFL